MMYVFIPVFLRKHPDPQRNIFIGDGGPHARTQEGKECRSRGLESNVISVGVFSYVSRADKRFAKREGLHTGTLHVADDRPALIVHKLNAHLGDASAGA